MGVRRDMDIYLLKFFLKQFYRSKYLIDLNLVFPFVVYIVYIVQIFAMFILIQIFYKIFYFCPMPFFLKFCPMP